VAAVFVRRIEGHNPHHKRRGGPGRLVRGENQEITMRNGTRGRARLLGATVVTGALAIGGAVCAAGVAGAGSAGVARAAGVVTPNPNFVANAQDAINPAVGADAHAHIVVNSATDGRSIMTLHIAGLPASRSFGAHLHRDPCDAGFGGPHYQAPDPATPTPGNADAAHEMWLDFTTNSAGIGRTHVDVPFAVIAGARSVVVHQGAMTLPGGGAGQRLACLDVDL
jgi:Cu-Zn family superoxide dismutase